MSDLYEYGNKYTWHDSKALDIEVDRHGNVVAVWFRCTMLPYRVTIVDDMRASEMTDASKYSAPELHAVTLRRSNG